MIFLLSNVYIPPGWPTKGVYGVNTGGGDSDFNRTLPSATCCIYGGGGSRSSLVVESLQLKAYLANG